MLREERATFVQRTADRCQADARAPRATEMSDFGAKAVAAKTTDKIVEAKIVETKKAEAKTAEATDAKTVRPGAVAAPRSERDDIARRVAAFRDRQLMLRQQREDYYDATLSRTRAALRTAIRQPHA